MNIFVDNFTIMFWLLCCKSAIYIGTYEKSLTSFVKIIEGSFGNKANIQFTLFASAMKFLSLNWSFYSSEIIIVLTWKSAFLDCRGQVNFSTLLACFFPNASRIWRSWQTSSKCFKYTVRVISCSAKIRQKRGARGSVWPPAEGECFFCWSSSTPPVTANTSAGAFSLPPPLVIEGSSRRLLLIYTHS